MSCRGWTSSIFTVDHPHDLSIKVAVVDGVVPEVCVELAVPVPILHMLRDARFGWVLENAPVSVLEIDHVDRRVELVLGQRITGRLPPLASLQTVSDGDFQIQGRPLAR
ncbi:hypothetical protein PanWU01x14_324300 [Parasponia andersonii]|uniref:Uncharacterized protein n=1 Tax=Parasponia andersonii TaxID=3476 RepID=A0A2P5AK59_PARAD|nr:hypothetical protein PanWU01x14_324300 [Parasponia andersonii]